MGKKLQEKRKVRRSLHGLSLPGKIFLHIFRFRFLLPLALFLFLAGCGFGAKDSLFFLLFHAPAAYICLLLDASATTRAIEKSSSS